MDQKKFILCLSFVVTVLGLDLAINNLPSLKFLSLVLRSGFDVTKFVTWLVLPFILFFSIHKVQRIKFSKPSKQDWIILLVISVLGIASMFLIPHISSLTDYYKDQSHLGFEEKKFFIQKNLLWIVSWLFGWEFMFRCFLLNCFSRKNENYALIVLPLVEGLYHFTKPLPEILGMILFSFILTKWTLKSKNFFPAIFSHFLIEVFLVGFLIL